MLKNTNRNLVTFINVKIDTITKEDALTKAKEFVESGQYHYQISVNVAKLVNAQKDKRLKTAINDADIINADGMPIHFAAKLLSKSESTRMGGWDYIDELATRYPNFRYYFFGSQQKVVEYVVSNLRRRYRAKIVGFRNGYFHKQEVPDIIKEINEKDADILFIALGTPAKEYFLRDMKGKLKVKFAIGVGGAFDLIAGKRKRAPKLLQQIGCEWLYRLFQEPKRMFKRYAVTNSIFVILVIRELLSKLIEKFQYLNRRGE